MRVIGSGMFASFEVATTKGQSPKEFLEVYLTEAAWDGEEVPFMLCVWTEKLAKLVLELEPGEMIAVEGNVKFELIEGQKGTFKGYRVNASSISRLPKGTAPAAKEPVAKPGSLSAMVAAKKGSGPLAKPSEEAAARPQSAKMGITFDETE